jgi:multiple sugar transport system substrate-binding protein
MKKMKKVRMRSSVIAPFLGVAVALAGLVTSNVSANAASRTVVVWSPYKGANLKLWNAAIGRIEAANPGLKITSVGSIDMAKSLAAINAGHGPDISVSNGSGNLGWFCGSGAWQNLSNLITDKSVGIDLKATFTAASLASTVSNNNRCALPLNTEVFGLFYNKDLLAKAGFKQPPKTTDDLLAMSKKLTTFDAKGDIKTAGFVPWAGYYGFGMESVWLGQSFGAQWYSAGKSAFGSDQAWVQAFNWQHNFIAQVFGGGDFAKGSRLLTKFVAARGDEWGTGHDFMTGRVAMKWDANWMAPQFCTGDAAILAEKCTQKVNFGIAPFPVAPNLASTLYGSGTADEPQMGISKGSKNMKDAWIVLKALATDTALAAEWDKTNGAPSALLASSARPKNQPSWYEPIYQIGSNPKSGYHTMVNTGEHQDEGLLQDLMSSWQANHTPDISKALASIGTQVNQIIANNK